MVPFSTPETTRPRPEVVDLGAKGQWPFHRLRTARGIDVVYFPVDVLPLQKPLSVGKFV